MTLDERNQTQRIRSLLQDEEVQARIQKNIRRGREDAKVTIGRASELFNIKPSKLRELDELLKLARTKDAGNAQRQYSLTELDKLAILSELLNNGRISLSDIPSDIDEIWNSVSSRPKELHAIGETSNEAYVHMSIDHRVEDANKEEFWRYFASQALRMALNLICEDIPEPIAGIILPLKRKTNATVTHEPQDLAQLGECLVGWRDQNRSYHTFYDPSPFFEFPSDFRVSGLLAVTEQEPKDRTFVVLQRKAKFLYPALPVVETVRRLLAPIYEDVHVWQSYFDRGMRDVVYPTTSFGSTTVSDSILTSLTEMAVRLGGKTASGQNCWKFCSVLLPNKTSLSLPLGALVVQAQNNEYPHTINNEYPYTIGKTYVSSDTAILSLSQRAFQSGRVLYRPLVSSEDKTIAYRELEGPIQSAVAIPIEGRDGLPIAILYLVSEVPNAFDIEHQRILRFICRMIGEMLETSSVRQQGEGRLRDIVTQPKIVNKTLGAFASENRFTRDVETLLKDVRDNLGASANGVTSFISIDVDNITNVTSKYGEQMLINFSRVLGERIRDQATTLFDKQTDWQIYHIYADRFYLLLKGKTLEQVRESAEKLRIALQGSYYVPIIPNTIEQQRNKVELKDITVRLAVSSYQHEKLYKLLQRYPVETQIVDIIFSSILDFLDVALNIGKQEGGNNIVSYYPPEPPKYEHSRFALWSPPKNEA